MKKVYGVGVNDADYVVQVKESVGYINGKRKFKLIWACPFYRVWMNMLQRCYSERTRSKYPTYANSSVCEEWLSFNKFKAWMEKQNWEGRSLDKDLLSPGNKIYSPDICVFVTSAVNTFVVERNASRGQWPIGVSWGKQSGAFRAQCSNPLLKRGEDLGYFSTPEEAHQAWLTRKLELAKLLAAEQDDPRVAKALVERYENYNMNSL